MADPTPKQVIQWTKEILSQRYPVDDFDYEHVATRTAQREAETKRAIEDECPECGAAPEEAGKSPTGCC